MKAVILGYLVLAGTYSYAALSPASQFVHDTLTQGKQILEGKDEAERFSQMCAMISARFHQQQIAGVWLGEYAGLGRDQAAINRFPGLVPAVLIGKVFGDLRGGGGTIKGTFRVDESPVDRGQGILEVPVTLTSPAGRDYRGSAILREEAGLFRAIDIEYMNMSAVQYQGQEFRDLMKEEYDKDVKASLPVSVLIDRIESDSTYRACP